MMIVLAMHLILLDYTRTTGSALSGFSFLAQRCVASPLEFSGCQKLPLLLHILSLKIAEE